MSNDASAINTAIVQKIPIKMMNAGSSGHINDANVKQVRNVKSITFFICLC